VVRWAAISLGLVSLAALSAGGYYVYQRHVRLNFGTVVEGQVYRSAQPTAEKLSGWVQQYGLRTIINLRGENPRPAEEFEGSISRQFGVRLVHVRLSAMAQPPRRALRQLIEEFETAPRPILIHCLAGADRTGMASVLAAMAVGGRPYAEARGELSLWHLHFDRDPDHIGGLFDEYEEYCRRKHLDTGGWLQFRDWALTVYHPGYYHLRIESDPKIITHPEALVYADLVLTNCSNRTIPAGDPNRTFTTAVYSGSVDNDPNFREYCERDPLPKQDIPPGASVKVRQRITVPRTPGTYRIHFDVVEENRTWFSQQGSETGDTDLVVIAPQTRP
jgi:protein tyrosine/serine phosphatase